MVKKRTGLFRIIFIVFCFSAFLGTSVIGNLVMAKQEVKGTIKNTCFVSDCHSAGDFSPGDKSSDQWASLIGDDEHAIFANIDWKSEAQKKKVLEYLKNHASDTQRTAKGIGVWE